MQQHNQNTNMPQPGPNNFFYPPMPMIPNQLNPQQAAQMQQYMPQIPPQQPPDGIFLLFKHRSLSFKSDLICLILRSGIEKYYR